MLNTKQISEMLNVSEETVRRWIRNKELTAQQEGKSYFVEENELERFLEVKANKPGTSISSLASLIPTLNAVAKTGGKLAGKSIFDFLDTSKSKGSSVTSKFSNDITKNNLDSIEDLDFHIESLQRKRKKLILEHELELLKIDEEIAFYKKMKER